MRIFIFCSNLLVASCFFVSCKSKFSVSEYENEVSKKAEYRSEYSDANTIVSCMYLPSTILAVREVGNDITNSEYRKNKFVEAKKSFQNFAYFKLTIRFKDGSSVLTNNLNDQAEYAQRLNYLSRGMGNDFFIVRPTGDTVRALTYEFERNYGNSPEAEAIFVFPKELTIGNGDDELQFHFVDRLLGIYNTVRLVFINKDLQEKEFNITF